MTDVNQLLQGSADLGSQSLTILSGANINAQIGAAMGIAVNDVQSSETVLLNLLIDDSSSMSPVVQGVIDGHNGVLDALLKTKQHDSILAHCFYLNGTILYPYTPLASATRMSTANYHAMGGTPLYDKTILLCGTVATKAADFNNQGVPCRSISLIVTDGDDYGSSHRVGDVETVVTDMLKSENHIIAGLGLGDEARFRSIFKRMGIRDEWILTAASDAHAIRSMFNLFSQSAVRASQGGATFSKTSAGGFTS